MSTLKTSNIQHASAASAAITLDANGQATLNGLAYPTSGSLSGRNRIINGDMRIDQRNAGASITTAAGNNFPVDRWIVFDAVGSKFTSQRESSIVPSRFTNSLRVTSSAATTPGSADYYFVCQRIEGFNAADLGFGSASAQSITVSFWVRSSLTGTFSGSIGNTSFTRAYPFTYSISSANTWEQKSVTIPGDTSGTWATDNTSGLQVVFDLGSGSSRQGTAGAWTSSDHRAVTGSVQVVATNGATFYITGVQLEAGSVATPFERRSYGQELSLCERYYEMNTTTQDLYRSYQSYSSGSSSWAYLWKTEKRVAPTVTYSQTNFGTPIVDIYGSYWKRSGAGGPLTVAVYGPITADAEL